jgi:hypothetical protein
VIVEPASGATCLGGDTIPRKEQVLQRPQGGWTIWTRRWSKTLKPPGVAQQCAASNGGGHDDHGRGTRRSRIRVRGSIATLAFVRWMRARFLQVLRRVRRSVPSWARPRVGFGRARVSVRCGPSGAPCPSPPGAAGPSIGPVPWQQVPCPYDGPAAPRRWRRDAVLPGNQERSRAPPRQVPKACCRMGNRVASVPRPARSGWPRAKSRC